MLLIVTTTYAPAFSQTTATETKIEYQKGVKPAAVIEMPYPAEIVEGALRENITTRDVKEARLKGMQVFKGARLTPADGEVVDLYFRVERKGRRGDSTAVVYLILGRPNENVALRTPGDLYRIEDGKAFLNKIVPAVGAYQLEVKIKAQEDLIKKSERNLKGLLDDQKLIEERIRDLQDKLTQNRKDQESQIADLAKQRSTRDVLLTQRTVSSK